ncbi:hypothetical protein GCM10010492_61840 [Saccharothrix mutabilis subsp. mutabilis]|uniref:Leucine-rich repeat domain-containing protein n=1 Tax=Saccharothrix mutabilis subsp. mutabilis TaxID=66855 RepID=A0ABN0UK91_9PSEU
MPSDEQPPQSFPNRFATATGPTSREPDRDRCQCLRPATRKVSFHRDRQDTTAPGWLRLLELVDEAAADGRAVFQPFAELSGPERRQVVTLPPTIAKLTAVEKLVLYGTNLVRIPPEIGAMSGLRVFEPYTSHRLHWYPYELTRCALLTRSTVSTRALYGNFKHRPPFPALRPAEAGLDLTDLDPGARGATAVRTCGVCDGPVGELHQVWISRWVGTDVLPLLVNACSAECVAALPEPAPDHVPTPHTGGPDVVQPAGRW